MFAENTCKIERIHRQLDIAIEFVETINLIEIDRNLLRYSCCLISRKSLKRPQILFSNYRVSINGTIFHSMLLSCFSEFDVIIRNRICCSGIIRIFIGYPINCLMIDSIGAMSVSSKKVIIPLRVTYYKIYHFIVWIVQQISSFGTVVNPKLTTVFVRSCNPILIDKSVTEVECGLWVVFVCFSLSHKIILFLHPSCRQCFSGFRSQQIIFLIGIFVLTTS